MSLEAVLLRHRILLIMEPLSPETARQVIGALLLLDAEDPDEPIELFLNSPGGTVSDVLAIIDTIRWITAPVATVALGQVAGMATWLLAAGRPGLRVATSHAQIVLSSPPLEGVKGPGTDLECYARHVASLQEQLLKLLAEWTGRTLSQLERDIERPCFLSAQEALQYGLVDRVLYPPTWEEKAQHFQLDQSGIPVVF
ncbi:MAG: ATP-dependent Clp protease proteolytic subunit [Candidatus Poribacteria bacterium]|nr:MAG: ATP-dependent Clp protease proteolytic subunit [Candidatus Poribacteria bacterium]